MTSFHVLVTRTHSASNVVVVVQAQVINSETVGEIASWGIYLITSSRDCGETVIKTAWGLTLENHIDTGKCDYRAVSYSIHMYQLDYRRSTVIYYFANCKRLSTWTPKSNVFMSRLTVLKVKIINVVAGRLTIFTMLGHSTSCLQKLIPCSAPELVCHPLQNTSHPLHRRRALERPYSTLATPPGR